ncbi:TetR/AcrR family transcriptional regulator [Millisia brevis]|uniref:TetR/AcrR family transcriptional regulator n=1 Tax=Millisia brevis TaxID=264148 RepID=UPI001470DDC6|nr:TetR/AcrR family transcriptional regulator [Millisia brevis]
MEGLRGLRDRKKAATRCALGAAALRIAREVGLDRATAETIAGAANVSTRTFHNYFGRKEDAILFHLGRIEERWTTALRERPADENVWDAIERATSTMLERFPEDADDLRAIVSLSSTYPQLTALRLSKDREGHPVQQAIAERLPTGTDAMTVTLIAHVAVVTINSALTTAGDDAVSRRRYLTEGFALLRNGFGTLPATVERSVEQPATETLH